MQVGQRLTVVEPCHLGHKAIDQTQQALGAVDEEVEQFFGIDALFGLALVEPAFGAGRIFGGRHPQQGQEIAALEMGAFLGKLRCALALDQRRGRIGKVAIGVIQRRAAHRLNENGPA